MTSSSNHFATEEESDYDDTDSISNEESNEEMREVEAQMAFLSQGRDFFEVFGQYHDQYLVKQPVHNREISGWALLLSMLNGADIRAYQDLRMYPNVFLQFCEMLVDEFGLQKRRDIAVEEEVAIFLKIVGTGMGNRVLQEFFQRGAATISSSFHNVLNACCRMAEVWITPDNDFKRVPQYIRNKPHYYPFFKDVIGAIDGTHVKVCVPANERVRYIGRKGIPTQNILAVCDFNMRFTFVVAGYEGITHDSRMLTECLRNENDNFPKPPPGKYYLVDAGFANNLGFMNPYPRTRYHLPEFQQMRRGYNRPEELFNHRHSALRSVIERSFGVWKKRFHILNDMPCNLKLRTQVCLIAATMTIHNFLCKVTVEDDRSDLSEYIKLSPLPEPDNDLVDEDEATSGSTSEDNIRDNIHDQLWNAYHHRD